jgi:serpin B
LATALKPRGINEGWGKDARTVPAYELRIANALWGQEKLTFEEPFLATLDREFGAPLSRVDFRETKKVRNLINAWVEQQTAKKIRNIVPPGLPTPDTRLVLSNAIYFKASWAESFQERATKPALFTTLDGKKLEVPMMHRVDHYRYAATDDVQIVEIPYRGGDASMLVVLPKKRDGLLAVEAKLDSKRIGSLCGKLRPKRVQLKLPRFEFTSAFDLAENLPAMGMEDAFNAERANFKRMTLQVPLFIGAVLHKAFIAVDESGTEAAAATVVMMKVGSARQPEKPVPFVADHSFLFFIQHRKTGCILFAGRVTKPESSAGAAKSAKSKR